MGFTTNIPWVRDSAAEVTLTRLQIASPILLLLLYIFAFLTYSVFTASNSNDDTTKPEPEQLGPGGKPLPKKNKKESPVAGSLEHSRPRKLLFQWLGVGLLGTFCGSITVVILHAYVMSEQRWWCGQAATVSWMARKASHMS